MGEKQIRVGVQGLRILRFLADETDSNGEPVEIRALAKQLAAGSGWTGRPENFTVEVYRQVLKLAQDGLVSSALPPGEKIGKVCSLTDAGRVIAASVLTEQTTAVVVSDSATPTVVPAQSKSSNPLSELLVLQARVCLVISQRLAPVLEAFGRLAALEKDIQDIKAMLGDLQTDQQEIVETRVALEAALEEFESK